MARLVNTDAEEVLEQFVEIMFKLMVDHHQQQVIDLDLTMPQAQALRALRRKPLCPGELAAELRISAPAVTQLTDRLKRKRLIERRADEADRRSVMVALTATGKRAVDKFRERRRNIFSGAFANLADSDRARVVIALGKVVAALEHHDAQAAVVRNSASKSLNRARSQAKMPKGRRPAREN